MSFYSQIRCKILPQILKYHSPSCFNVSRHLAVFTKHQGTSYLNTLISTDQSIILHQSFNKLSVIQFRPKTYSRRGKQNRGQPDDDEGSDSDDEIPQESKLFQHSSKVADIQTDSLRCDLILKNGLGISRNKLEMMFYEGRIRINGNKILKKSTSVNLGDEVDLIKKFDDENPKLLHVGRVEVLKGRPTGDYIVLTVRKFKNLLVHNYETDPWEEKSPEPEPEPDDKQDEEITKKK